MGATLLGTAVNGALGRRGANAQVDAPQATDPWVAYGFVVRGQDIEHPVVHPDISRMAGRYAAKGSTTAVLEITVDRGRAYVRFLPSNHLPTSAQPIEIVFDRRPKKPTGQRWSLALLLIFELDATARPVLTGLVSGDVGGELVPAP